MLNRIKIKGRTNTWSELKRREYKGKTIVLMENDIWGDETEWILIDLSTQEEIANGYDYDIIINPDDYLI